ncbi:hypothetical protein [Micromonospora sp. NPDC049679]|uniref:hypothetical protein n=1 Tax=Micromonospora sp. NPDC049679 TaxID=3155920 RepID=UPI0033F2010D
MFDDECGEVDRMSAEAVSPSRQAWSGPDLRRRRANDTADELVLAEPCERRLPIRDITP